MICHWLNIEIDNSLNIFWSVVFNSDLLNSICLSLQYNFIVFFFSLLSAHWSCYRLLVALLGHYMTLYIFWICLGIDPFCSWWSHGTMKWKIILSHIHVTAIPDALSNATGPCAHITLKWVYCGCCSMLLTTVALVYKVKY